MFGRISRLWNRIWFEPIPPYPLAAFRVFFGVYLLAYFLRYLPIVEIAFSNEGVYSPYLIPDIAPGPVWAWFIYGAALVAVLALTVGWHTRIAAVAVFLLFEYHHYLNFAITGSAYDRLNVINLFVLCIANPGAAWSLDARKRNEVSLIPAWQIRLLQFEIAAFYFGAGVCKLINPVWRTGDMLELTLASPWASSLGFEILNLKLPEWLYTGLTWSVVVFELFAGFGLFFRRTRTPTMIAGTLFHLFNTFVLVIPEFLNCVTMYALFLPWTKNNRGKSATDTGAADTVTEHLIEA